MTNDQTTRRPTIFGSGIILPNTEPSHGLLPRLHSMFVVRHCLLFLLALFPHAATCQSRLDQLEATYQSNLRALDAPILQEYLRQLDFLKSQFLARNRADDAKQ